MALNDEIMLRQRIANVAFSVIAFLGIVLAYMLARRNKAKQIINRLLEEKVKQELKNYK